MLNSLGLHFSPISVCFLNFIEKALQNSALSLNASQLDIPAVRYDVDSKPHYFPSNLGKEKLVYTFEDSSQLKQVLNSWLPVQE